MTTIEHSIAKQSSAKQRRDQEQSRIGRDSVVTGWSWTQRSTCMYDNSVVSLQRQGAGQRGQPGYVLAVLYDQKYTQSAQ